MIGLTEAIIVMLLLVLIWGSGLEFGIIATLTLGYLWIQALNVPPLNYIVVLTLLVPIPLTAIIVGQSLDQVISLESRRIITALTLVLSTAITSYSGYIEESLVAVAERGVAAQALPHGPLILAALSASLSCSLLVGGIVTALVATIELSFYSIFAVTRTDNPIALSMLRPYLIIGIVALGSNLVITLVVSRLHPFSILKAAGI